MSGWRPTNTHTPYEEHAWFWGLEHDSDGMGHGIHWIRDGFAARCIKDADFIPRPSRSA